MGSPRIVLTVLRRAVVSVLLGVVLVLAAGAGLWLVSGNWVATRLTGFANKTLFEDRTTRLLVGKVTGSVVGGVSFEDVRLERFAEGEWHPAFRAERVDARYELAGWIRRRRAEEVGACGSRRTRPTTRTQGVGCSPCARAPRETCSRRNPVAKRVLTTLEWHRG